MTETDLQKIGERTLIRTNVPLPCILILYSEIFFRTDVPLLRQGSTALSLLHVLVERIVMFPSCPYSFFVFLSPPMVPSFTEVNPTLK